MFNVILTCSKEQKEESSNEELVDAEVEQSELIEATSEEEPEETLSGGFTDEYYQLMEKKRIVDIYID